MASACTFNLLKKKRKEKKKKAERSILSRTMRESHTFSASTALPKLPGQAHMLCWLVWAQVGWSWSKGVQGGQQVWGQVMLELLCGLR